MKISAPPETKVTRESLKAYFGGKRTIVNQGGTRSGKTYSLIQCLIYIAHTQKLSISICSLSFPHLRRGAMRDWREIMEYTGLYKVASHQKTENTYYFDNGSYIEFFSVDNALKVRGPGRDVLFINEANLIDHDTYRQLAIRTTRCIFIDYNPADEFHWIYDIVLPKETTSFIQSTYLDNRFLTDKQIAEIESYKSDANYWKVYGLGERGFSEGVIYTHWKLYNGKREGNVYYGLDFGYDHPSALVRITDNPDGLFVEELIYQSHLTIPELVSLVKQQTTGPLYCDPSQPSTIKSLQLAGVRAFQANNEVSDGILYVKSRSLYIHSDSVNLIKEIKSYQRKPKTEAKDLVPMKTKDDALDAMRYATTPIRIRKDKQSQPMFFR